MHPTQKIVLIQIIVTQFDIGLYCFYLVLASIFTGIGLLSTSSVARIFVRGQTFSMLLLHGNLYCLNLVLILAHCL